MLEASPTLCNLCLSPRRRYLFAKFGYGVVRCLDCSLECLERLPDEAELTAWYDEGYYRGNPERRGYLDYVRDREPTLLSFRSKVADLARYLPTNPTQAVQVLDVGAATGWFLEAAAERGWQGCGLEVSEYAQKEARLRGHDVRLGGSPADFAPSQFDLVTMWDVIEHLRNPRQTLLEAHAALRPGGLLALSTGDVGHPLSKLQGRRNRMYNPPQHLYFFSRPTLTAMLEACGFEVLGVQADQKTTTLHYVLHIAGNLVDLPLAADTAQALNRTLPNLPITLRLVDNLVVFARPKASYPPGLQASHSDTPAGHHDERITTPQ